MKNDPERDEFWINIAASLAAAIFVVWVLSGCATTVAKYNETSYQQVTRCKAESLKLVEKATTPYSAHLDEIQTVSVDILAAYEFDAGRKLNHFSIQMWDVILNEEGHTYAGFMILWQKSGTLGRAFVQDQRSIISRAWNQLIDAEYGKIHE